MKSLIRIVLMSGITFVAGIATTHAVTLPPTNNLVLWLKPGSLSLSDGSPVTLWTDSSGNGNNATTHQGTGEGSATSPTYVANGINGRPAVLFNGAFDFLALDSTIYQGARGVGLPTGLTFAVEFRTTSTDTTPVYAGNTPQTLIGDNTGNISLSFGLNGGQGEYIHYAGGWQNLTGSALLNDGNAHSLIVTHQQSDGLIGLYADGTSQGSATIAYNAASAFNRISGGFFDGTHTYDNFDGVIGEVLVYSTALSGADQLALQTYLNESWSAVPEPSTVGLVGLGLVALWLRRKH